MNNSPVRQKKPLYTIGILTARLNGPNEINLWHGVAERAKERNINLFFFSGGIPHWTQLYEAQRNILFNIAGKENVDGLLVWANILSHTLDQPGLRDFCQRYLPLPIISMGGVIPSIQSTRIDMQGGMRKLLAHLIEIHGRKKIGFIRGPLVSQDAEARYSAYLETLNYYGLPLDPRLIVSGDFRRYAGTAAVKQLMDVPGLDFDAIVSANDNMAIGALQELQERGIRVPEDIIVAGFDDIEETRAVVPSLTTIRSPWHLLGMKSMDLVISCLDGKPLQEEILLETELSCRQSCGCQQAMINIDILHPKKAAQVPEVLAGKKTSQPVTLDGRKIFAAEIESLLNSKGGLDIDLARKLADAFVLDLLSREDGGSSYLLLLAEILERIPSGTEIIEWQNVFTLVRAKTYELFQSQEILGRAEYLIGNANALIGEIAHRHQLSERLQTVNQTNRLNRIVQTMSTTHDIERLMTLLAAELPRLGIQSCFLSLYDEKGEEPAWSRLILAVVAKQRLPLPKGGLRFPTRRLIPAGLLPAECRYAFDVEALHFQEQQIGFVMFEIGPADGEVYTTLQGHISSALKSAELVQVALEAEAKAIKSDQLKTYLLANVSHELRAPLNIILGLSQMALASPNPYGIDFPAQLSKDMGYIYESGEHLIRLINDLLDTSRAEIGELDLCFEPVSPRVLLKEAFDAFAQTSTAKQKEVELVLQIPEHLPVLRADPVRLRQILMNLLSNAFKFTKSGRVVMGAEVQLPHIHFWVADTGLGISPELQERIFEPFVKVDPPGKRREGIGLGLSITRRLVALHGGTITLDSQPDQGSTFHVYLPLPGLDQASSKAVDSQDAKPLMLWLSSKREPSQAIKHICEMNGFIPYRLAANASLERVLEEGKPVALAWDLENARPGDWFLVLKLRSHAPFCQIPLLLFHDSLKGSLDGRSGLTNILPKPLGNELVLQVLNLLPQNVQKGEIWIIDDDPQALKYYQELIGASITEYIVRPIQGGMEAIRLLQEATPCLVLLDLVMPDVDGFQVLERMRENVNTSQVPVIIMSGKLLSYEDIKRLDAPKVLLQTKGILSAEENAAGIQKILSAGIPLPQPTALLIKKAAAFIHQNYSRSFTLEELSETIGVSRSYLSRIFKEDMGISPWDYLHRFRVQKARELLLLTDAPITSIAAEVGYEDVGYFARAFRAISGVSPRNYRRQSGIQTND